MFKPPPKVKKEIIDFEFVIYLSIYLFCPGGACPDGFSLSVVSSMVTNAQQTLQTK
jgi:hypothetical protein